MNFRLILLLLIPGWLIAQAHEPVFPNLSGNELIMQLQSSYTPDSVLSYGMGRDTLFKNIDSVNDTLYGVYTRHAVYLTPDEDPTVAAFMNGSANGINTEHAWPRSKGASRGNAESDLQHLYPTRTPVNSDRASLPYGEVDDFTTQKWYRLNQTESQIPNNFIDEYSELGNNFFEPREDFKGDIARSMFYFYTIYRQEAEDADPDFFQIQRADLCAWHLADPVDAIEWNRTHEIASYQSGKTNPFILDCTLAHRAYCQDFIECEPTSDLQDIPTDVNLKIYPNPSTDILFLDYDETAYSGPLSISIYNSMGEVALKTSLSRSKKSVSIAHLPEGFYLIKISDGLKIGIQKIYIVNP